MSMQEVCEVGAGADLTWMSPRHMLNSFTAAAAAAAASSPSSPSVNSLTNTTTSARPLPDPGHCVQQLRALLPSRPDIGFLRTDSDFLLRFLKVRNFQVASAFQLLCGYYCYRQRERDLFKCTLGGAGVRSALSDGVVGLLPERDSSGSAVLVILASNCDDTKCCLADVWGAVLLSLEKLACRGEEAGLVCVVDWSECPAKLNADLNHKALRLVLDGLQDAFPLRLSGLHLLNVPWWSGPALRLARAFIKEKTRSRIHVHGNNLSSLHKHLPPRLLPAQLGGEGGEYRPASWANTVLDNTANYSKAPDNSSDSSRLLNSTAVKSSSATEKEVKEEPVKCPASDKEEEEEEVEEPDDPHPPPPITKGFTLEGLIKSGSKKFQLAQITEDSQGYTLKKFNKSSSVEYSSNSPTKDSSSSNSIFNFSKSKSLSLDIDDADVHNEEELESVYNFPKPNSVKSASSSFTSSITSSLTNNMNKMGFNIRSKDGMAAYDRGQPSSHLLLAADSATPT